MLLQGDVRIWSFATLYGLAAGVITYAASSSEGWLLDVLAFAVNYPALMAIFAILPGVSISPFFFPVVIIALSVIPVIARRNSRRQWQISAALLRYHNRA